MPDPQVPPRPESPDSSTLLDRVHQWRADPRVGAIVIGFAVVAAVVVWMRSAAGSDAPTQSAATAATSAPSGATTSTSNAGPIVHVVGAVRASGVVQLSAGARVRDAIVAAGGAADDADLQRLNLAARVTDGERIAVPRIGEAVPPPPVGATAGDTSGAGGDASGPLSLNGATAEQLEALPGIGPTLAAAIVEEREKLGGFKSVDDLKRVRGIGDARFADIRDLVTL